MIVESNAKLAAAIGFSSLSRYASRPLPSSPTRRSSDLDMVALAEHQLSTNAAYHKRRRWNLYGSPLLLLIAFGLLAYSIHMPSFFIVVFIVVLVAFLWAVRAYRHFPRKAVEKLHREKPQ